MSLESDSPFIGKHCSCDCFCLIYETKIVTDFQSVITHTYTSLLLQHSLALIINQIYVDHLDSNDTSNIIWFFDVYRSDFKVSHRTHGTFISWCSTSLAVNSLHTFALRESWIKNMQCKYLGLSQRISPWLQATGWGGLAISLCVEQELLVKMRTLLPRKWSKGCADSG